jgi:hypothetical protein
MSDNPKKPPEPLPDDHDPNRVPGHPENEPVRPPQPPPPPETPAA